MKAKFIKEMDSSNSLAINYLDQAKEFKDLDEAINHLIEITPIILDTIEIPLDIMEDGHINTYYLDKIAEYLKKDTLSIDDNLIRYKGWVPKYMQKLIDLGY